MTEAEIERGKLKAALGSHFEPGAAAAFTTDLWTDDINKISYFSFTIHFIRYHMKLHDFTMDLADFQAQSHTAEPAEAVRNHLTGTLTSLGIHDWDRCKIVFDDGSFNARNGITSLFDRIPCADHKLGVVLSKVLQK